MFKPARATNTVLVVFAVAILLHAQTAKDPGVRPTPIGAGSYYGNLPAAQVSVTSWGKERGGLPRAITVLVR